jgi:hypothetical protein
MRTGRVRMNPPLDYERQLGRASFSSHNQRDRQFTAKEEKGRSFDGFNWTF